MNGFKVLALLALAFAAIPSQAQVNDDEEETAPQMWCFKGDGSNCMPEDLRNKTLSQVLIFPTGYQKTEQIKFYDDFAKVISFMSNTDGSIYASVYKSKMIYIGFWMPGDALGGYGANFAAKIGKHPVRGNAVQLNSNDVYSTIGVLRSRYYKNLRPWAVAVLLNTEQKNVTANATLANFAGRQYGVGRIPRTSLDKPYTATHEIAHAGLNFLDEYVEEGMENMSLKLVDYATPLAMLDDTWGSWKAAIEDLLDLYDYNISEILAANGNDNIDTTKYPSRVKTQGYSPDVYPYESGFFFGRGAFHDRGKNLMNTNRVVRADDDGFAYAHSPSQKRVIKHAIDRTVTASRPNDRIRAAGPKNDWTQWCGSKTKLLMFDADKNNRLQPTQYYTVQVGWYERNWKTCFAGGFFPYACYDSVWTTFEKNVYPDTRSFNLANTKIYKAAGVLQEMFCSIGVGELSGFSGPSFCSMSVDQMAEAYLPTLSFPVPYQEVEVPASQWMTDYFWRFSSTNSRYTTGFTAWSKFTRKF